ncbi:MerR family transcriptional regulator [Clostridium sp. SHJSY1]|uniref:MerR family transcriptional regulator n=1 Tax=Clostridium sp. SHJSY1 TaxID=2942483 RepID=UPI0028741825|nr:MerR family transcriptional regulator [Clostridium sp. SHJSY1]MDS0524640.1 MerR family transcriptional regulator [Clostridium sp. SHJSY1]
MRTVKQVSDLTGISVRTLHYYDEIGLLKPSKKTESGYRLYDDEILKTLQQILFFKELDIPLKMVKEIMLNPSFNKIEALKNQEKLLVIKRDRLTSLIELINKTIKGENTMSFEEFDMTIYFDALENFKKEHEDMVIKYYGSIEKYNEYIEKFKSSQDKIAKAAIKQYGSIEKFTKSMLHNLTSSTLINRAEQYESFRSELLEDTNPKLAKLYKEIVADMRKDPFSKDIQLIAKEITTTVKEDYELFKSNDGDDNWYFMVRLYLFLPNWIKAVDSKYMKGSAEYIGKALEFYLKDNEPKSNKLARKLVSDLSKDPTSKEIQDIVKEISDELSSTYKSYNYEVGENHLGYTGEMYLTNPTFINAFEKNFGAGTAKFVGEAYTFFAKNSN